ncbi:MAG TPA: YicC family protein [Candidatus Gallimonas intestinigallinarum]|uniref:YicC family protein n=1 Tax=Candidatus Gallimonas intestinigallinarum TaxID=2838604 RepID=A0A9D2DXB1_9FIRM|nr:YicC family protein [Candidatus Gallimonas intestinigallinarum]
MFSMTGYGKGVCAEEGVELTAEVKSVNNRYLDLAIKSPRIFLAQEERIRAIAREHISRGHVDIFISYTDKREKEKSYYVDLSVARAYQQAAEQLKAALPGVADDTTLSFYLRLPDVVRTEEPSAADEVLEKLLERALHEAFSSLSHMREKEGERLKGDLLSRMQVIERLTEAIAARAPHVAEEYRKKLTERIEEYLAGKVDEARILTEAAVFADKCSIDEELTRLRSHIKAFREICALAQVGRKLDFLVQEFNRECNTICSKSSDKEITANALQMKNEIEKVREQIQNLE